MVTPNITEHGLLIPAAACMVSRRVVVPMLQITAEVEAPRTLGLSAYSTAEAHVPKFELRAMTHHAGSLSGGHYWTQCKSAVDGFWYLCNDSTVQASSPNTESYKTPHMAFYRLQDP